MVAAAAATIAGIAGAGPAPRPPFHRATVPHSTTNQPALPRAAIPVDIGATPVGRPIPAGFIGLSIEYRSALYYFGDDPAHPDPVFIQLVRNLTPGQSPVLRFGGDTTDWTWWPTPGVVRPAGIRYSLGPSWTAASLATARQLNARLILGINFEADSAAIARTESSQLLAGIGRPYVAGFELGNEPEVYGTLGWYFTPAGVPVLGRRASYRFATYLPDYARIAAALPRSVPLVGPASGAPKWLAGLGRYVRANPRVRLVTFHRYPLNRCFTGRASAAYPTIGHLLSAASSSGLADSLAAAVKVAHARGLPFRSDELNSVACGGKLGVSDTFASALWALDTLFAMARVGVDGVNIHTFGGAFYEPFSVHQDAAGQWSASVKPLYYGLLTFARAAPPGSRLLPTPGRAVKPLSIWATRTPGGTIRALLINDALRRTVQAAVRLPTTRTQAVATQLRAPRVGARTGVTLGGQTFASPTTTGTPTGRATDQMLRAVRGRFVVRLPPASATLLTVAS